MKSKSDSTSDATRLKVRAWKTFEYVAWRRMEGKSIGMSSIGVSPFGVVAMSAVPKAGTSMPPDPPSLAAAISRFLSTALLNFSIFESFCITNEMLHMARTAAKNK
eukprot:CAMPEP_0118662324 /NCGR_PEP_ID=MMETSP0785-20121206/16768_1 /TAXON_ID=91992 /ORGANISM="Bolidomonas pacifica, Strain CCMP 1866" /LENGTH=105 /DNA_ID=CAMNT_0006555855 /DNA_START=965 /DNA_END=1282 /DNA_ORIENTATION=-